MVVEYRIRKMKLESRQWKISKISAMFRLRYFWRSMAIMTAELIIIAPMPYPYVHGIDKIATLMVLRMYIFIRVLRDHHPLYVKRRDVWKEPRLKYCHNETMFNSMTIIRAVFKEYMGVCVIGIVLFIGIVYAYCWYIVDREAVPTRNWWEWVYLSYVTATTLGYGDFYPKTDLGRLVAVITVFTGVITTAFLVAALSQWLALTDMQQEASQWIRRRKKEKKHKQVAATFIQLVWHHYQWKTKYDNQRPRRDHKVEAEYNRKCIKYTSMLRDIRREENWGKIVARNLAEAKFRDVETILDDLRKHIKKGEHHSKESVNMLNALSTKLDAIQATFQPTGSQRPQI